MHQQPKCFGLLARRVAFCLVRRTLAWSRGVTCSTRLWAASRKLGSFSKGQQGQHGARHCTAIDRLFRFPCGANVYLYALYCMLLSHAESRFPSSSSSSKETALPNLLNLKLSSFPSRPLSAAIRTMQLSPGQRFARSTSRHWRLFRRSCHYRFMPSPQSLTRCSLPLYKLARKRKEAQRGSTFPWVDEFEMGHDRTLTAAQVIGLLAPLMGEERLQRIDRVVANRTFNVLPIVEGIYDMGNLAATMRSADALGFGAVHCIKNKRYKQSVRASGGAEKWLDVQLWGDTSECLLAAKDMGYQVVAAHLSPEAVDISAVDWTRPTAVVLGNEKEGVSDTTLAMADQCTVVPMVGFVESFNVSVAAALILYQARASRLQLLGHHGDLSKEEHQILKALMLLRNRGQTSEIVRHLLNRLPPDWQLHRNGGDWGTKFPEPPFPSEVRCHYWDGERCWGEAVVFPGKRCTHSAGHHPGLHTLNRHKLRLMCEAKGVSPLPAVLLGGAPRGAGAAPGAASGSGSRESGAAERQGGVGEGSATGTQRQREPEQQSVACV